MSPWSVKPKASHVATAVRPVADGGVTPPQTSICSDSHSVGSTSGFNAPNAALARSAVASRIAYRVGRVMVCNVQFLLGYLQISSGSDDNFHSPFSFFKENFNVILPSIQSSNVAGRRLRSDKKHVTRLTLKGSNG